MKLIYNVEDKPKFSQTLVFAFQQMIAIMAATLLVPMIMSSDTFTADPAAALFGAGIGTIIYILFTKRRSPVFLGSSFTFLGAYAAVLNQGYGYWGVLIGVGFAGLVYVVIAVIVKLVGAKWVNKLMPAVIIGPIVTLIGLSLSSTATGWLSSNGVIVDTVDTLTKNGPYHADIYAYSIVPIIIGLVTFFAIVIASVKGSKTIKLIPFIVGIATGYVVALICTLIGDAAGISQLQVMDVTPLTSLFTNFSIESIVHVPQWFILRAVETKGEYAAVDAAMIANTALIFVPIGVVELAQHIADHKNLGSIIERDLITDPGLGNTLLGDGIGSIVGSVFGCCANTTYGESIGCVAITGNASIVSIITAAVGCMVLSFLSPFVALINTIPKCVMGGACIALYGFIAVSGLQMLKKVDLGDSKNLFVVSAILVCGIGGLTFNFGYNEMTNAPILQVTSLAVALIVGIVTNLIVNNGKMNADDEATDGLTGAVDQMGNVEIENK